MGMLGRLRLQYRITVSVALGLAVILGIFAYLAISAVDDSREAAKKERLVWAQAMAAHVDDVLQRTLERVESMAQNAAHELEEDDPHLEKDLEAFAGSLFSDSLALFDKNGAPSWFHGSAAAADSSGSLLQPVVQRVLREGRAFFALCAAGPWAKESFVCLAAPIREGSGPLSGVLAVQLDPQKPDLGLLLSPDLGGGHMRS